MANTLKMKRSATAAKVPLTTDLALGELAMNTYDGKLYMKKNNGVDSVVEIGVGDMKKSDNLSGLSNVATARANLGVTHTAIVIPPITVALPPTDDWYELGSFTFTSLEGEFQIDALIQGAGLGVSMSASFPVSYAMDFMYKYGLTAPTANTWFSLTPKYQANRHMLDGVDNFELQANVNGNTIKFRLAVKGSNGQANTGQAKVNIYHSNDFNGCTYTAQTGVGTGTTTTYTMPYVATGNTTSGYTVFPGTSKFMRDVDITGILSLAGVNVTSTAAELNYTDGVTSNIQTQLNAKVSGVTGTAPIVSSGGTSPAITISAATTGAAGSMSAADKTKLDGIATGAQVNVPTDLSLGTITATTIPVNSSTGADITLPIATTSLAGLQSAADKTKLGELNKVASPTDTTADRLLTTDYLDIGKLDKTLWPKATSLMTLKNGPDRTVWVEQGTVDAPHSGFLGNVTCRRLSSTTARIEAKPIFEKSRYTYVASPFGDSGWVKETMHEVGEWVDLRPYLLSPYFWKSARDGNNHFPQIRLVDSNTVELRGVVSFNATSATPPTGAAAFRVPEAFRPQMTSAGLCFTDAGSPLWFGSTGYLVQGQVNYNGNPAWENGNVQLLLLNAPNPVTDGAVDLSGIRYYLS